MKKPSYLEMVHRAIANIDQCFNAYNSGAIDRSEFERFTEDSRKVLQDLNRRQDEEDYMQESEG